MVKSLTFSPSYIEFGNDFFGFDRLIYPSFSSKFSKKLTNIADFTGFTFMVWLMSNASNRSKLFNLLDIHYCNEKKTNFLKIYILNRKFYLKFLDQIENEIIISDFFDKWSQLTIKLSISKENVEISFILNGINLNIYFTYLRNELIFLNDSVEIIIGFDPPLKKKQTNFSEKTINNFHEYYRLGPSYFFEESLSLNEINLLYSIMDVRGTINLLKDVQLLNFDIMTTENFKTISLNFSPIKDNCYNKNFNSFFELKQNLGYLIDSLIFEIDPNQLLLVKQKNKKESNRIFLALNKSEKIDNFQAKIISDSKNSDFLYETIYNTQQTKMKMDNLFELLFPILENLSGINLNENVVKAFYVFFLEIFQNFHDPKNQKFALIFQTLKKTKNIFDGLLMQSLFSLFSKKIANKSETNSQNLIINNVKNFIEIIMNVEFYTIFFSKNQDILDFLELFCRTFFNRNSNIFSE